MSRKRHPRATGRIGRTVEESVPWWPECDPGADRPHVLLVVFDDTGWGDFGCFGSEIATPTIDRMARDGLRYVNFHVTPLCSPTRASLLTGRNHHRVGMGWLADRDGGFPSRRGAVTATVRMLPQVLRDAGYGTFLVGKWHLAPAHQTTPGGPFSSWPLSRGFDRFYGFLDGVTDHYLPELVQDNHPIEPPRRPGYHLTEDLIDRAITYVSDHLAFGGGRPFFLEVAFGATHAPFQVDRSYIEPYVEVFAKGWDQTRLDRLARQKALGLLPPATQLSPRPDDVAAWEELSSAERRLATRLQAAFAGFLEHADDHLGRLIAHLDHAGVLENTVVMVLSDNGAAHDGQDRGSTNVLSLWNGVERDLAAEIDELDRIGSLSGPAQYPRGWAMAGNTPFRRYKQFVDAGGVRSPLILHWPTGLDAMTGVREQFAHAIDVMPTILDLAGVAPAAGRGAEEPPLDGASFRQTLHDSDAPAPRTTQYFEMHGHRAIWHDGWKAIAFHSPGEDYDRDTWRLYRVDNDPSEVHDLAGEFPEVLAELRERWEEEARDNGVFPLDDRSLADHLASSTPMLAHRFALRPQGSHISSNTYLAGSRQPVRVTASLSLTGDECGVIVSSGTRHGGYVLYLNEGRLVFEHTFLGQRSVVSAPLTAVGLMIVGFELEGGESVSRDVRLLVDGEIVAKGTIPVTAHRLSFWGMDVGADRGVPVSDRYPSDGFRFPAGCLDTLTMEVLAASPPSGLDVVMESSE